MLLAELFAQQTLLLRVLLVTVVIYGGVRFGFLPSVNHGALPAAAVPGAKSACVPPAAPGTLVADAEYEQQQAQDNYRTFLQQHPDFESDTGLRSEVQHLLEENEGLDLETAYWAARGKRAKQQQAEQQESRRAKRRAAKQAALTATGTPRRAGAQGRPTAGDLKRASAADILAIAQAMHRK